MTNIEGELYKPDCHKSANANICLMNQLFALVKLDEYSPLQERLTLCFFTGEKKDSKENLCV